MSLHSQNFVLSKPGLSLHGYLTHTVWRMTLPYLLSFDLSQMDDAKQEAGDKTSAGEMKSQADQVLEELGIPIAGEYRQRWKCQ